MSCHGSNKNISQTDIKNYTHANVILYGCNLILFHPQTVLEVIGADVSNEMIPEIKIEN